MCAPVVVASKRGTADNIVIVIIAIVIIVIITAVVVYSYEDVNRSSVATYIHKARA